MGLADRDYMRDRYYQRRGLGGGGGWFEEKNRSFDYQNGRRRQARSRQGKAGEVSLWSLAAPWVIILTFGAVGWKYLEQNGPIAAKRAPKRSCHFPKRETSM